MNQLPIVKILPSKCSSLKSQTRSICEKLSSSKITCYECYAINYVVGIDTGIHCQLVCVVTMESSMMTSQYVKNFMNYHKFTTVSSAKIPCSILNNIISITELCYQMCFVVHLVKFTPTKVPSIHTVD